MAIRDSIDPFTHLRFGLMTDVERTIVLFDQYPFLGGGQVVLLSIVEAAIGLARRVIVVAPVGGALEKVVRGLFGVRVQIIAAPAAQLAHGRKNWKDLVKMILYTAAFVTRNIALCRRADLLYGNGPRQFPALIILSWITGTRCCYHVHLHYGRLERLVIAIAARMECTHRVVVNSQYTYRRLIQSEPSLARNEKVIVIENALGPKYIGCAFVNRFESRCDRMGVLVLGVLRPEKGQDAAVELARRLPQIRVHIVGRVGEGAEDWARSLIAGAPTNVTFHEPTDDLHRFLEFEHIQINLVPSRWEEPFGLVAIEGMAESCITVVRSSGALKDIADKTGALLYQDGIQDLLETIVRLREMGSADLLALARRQFQATMECYGPLRLIEAMKQVLSEGLNS